MLPHQPTLTAKQFMTLLRERFTERANLPQNDNCSLLYGYHQERYYQIEIVDILQNAGYLAFSEYPFNYSDPSMYRQVCDIAIANGKDCWDYNTLIEIKPMLLGSNYWHPSKFFSSKLPFRSDIAKLAADGSHEAKKWFLLLMLSTKSQFTRSHGNLVKGRLQPGDVFSAINSWSYSKPIVTFRISISSIDPEKVFLIASLWAINRVSTKVVAKQNSKGYIMLC